MRFNNKEREAVYGAVNKAITALGEQTKAGRLAASEYEEIKLLLYRLRDIGLFGTGRVFSLRSYFKDIGAKGGTAAANNLTKRERSERARKASKTRWQSC